MKTLGIGLLLAGVLAARLALGQESAPEPSPAPAPSPADPPLSDAPAPAEPAEPAPPEAEPSPPPSAAFPEPAAPPASATAEFPAPPPPASASAAAPPPPSATVAGSALPPPGVPPPAAEQSGATIQYEAVAHEDESNDTNGLFGPFRLGPVVGVGLPAFLSFGGALKLTKYFGAGITYGVVPTLQFAYYGDATVSYQGVGIYGHIHPFGGGFFVGAAIGYAHVRGTYTDEFDISANAPAPIPGVNLESFPYTSEATMQTLVLTPELGYFYTFKSGFTLGVEFGLQFPVAPSEIEFTSHVDPRIPDQVVDQYVTPTDQRVESTLEKVGQTVLPTIGIKLGWLF